MTALVLTPSRVSHVHRLDSHHENRSIELHRYPCATRRTVVNKFAGVLHSLALVLAFVVVGSTTSSGFRLAECDHTALSGCSTTEAVCRNNCNRSATAHAQSARFLRSCFAGCQEEYNQCRRHARC